MQVGLNTKIEPALPYPVGITIHIFHDDGQWDRFAKWFMRGQNDINELYRGTITLRHYKGEDEPCYTAEQWARKSAEIVEQYPGCTFVYTAK